MQIDPWPIVGRAQLIQAFRPGEPPTKEGPFRTLRAHRWATAGVSVVTRNTRHASGRLTMFSVLNVSAARCARDGDDRTARAFAKAAGELEKSKIFVDLKELLSGAPLHEVIAAISGKVSPSERPALLNLLRAVARETRSMSPPKGNARLLRQIVTGTILEAREDGLILEASSGVKTLVPRWLGQAAHRELVGDALALITDKLEDNQMVVQALPAIELRAPRTGASPFGRSAPVRELNTADVRLLSRKPLPAKPLIPVDIEA